MPRTARQAAANCLDQGRAGRADGPQRCRHETLRVSPWSDATPYQRARQHHKHTPQSAVSVRSLPPNARVSKGTTIGYSDFVSDSGVVVKFDWTQDAESRRPLPPWPEPWPRVRCGRPWLPGRHRRARSRRNRRRRPGVRRGRGAPGLASRSLIGLGRRNRHQRQTMVTVSRTAEGTPRSLSGKRFPPGLSKSIPRRTLSFRPNATVLRLYGYITSGQSNE
jgi:hypothetical protein